MIRSLHEQMRGVVPVAPKVRPRDPWAQRLAWVAAISLIGAAVTIALTFGTLPPPPVSVAPLRIVVTVPPYPTQPPYPTMPTIQRVELVPTDIPPPPTPKVMPTPFTVCVTGTPHGTVCEWAKATSMPLPTRTPVPRCVTPVAGARCEAGPVPTLVTGWGWRR